MPTTPASQDRVASRAAREATRRAQTDMLSDHAGPTVAKAATKHWKTMSSTTWPEAIEELSAGIDVRTSCSVPGSSMYQHRLRFHPDGTIEPLDHPELSPSTLTGAPGEQLHQTACVEAALNNTAPYDCLHAALVLPDRKATITPYPKATGHPLHLHTRVGRDLRSIHTLVQWAVALTQHPDTTPALDKHRGEATLRYGITPAVLLPWLDDGWDIGTAIVWTQHRVPIEVANQWRTVGRTSVTDARAAAQGMPIDGDAWTQAGFSTREALAWKRLGNVAVTEAVEFHRRRISATLYKVWAAQRPDGIHTPTKEDLFAWVDAGIPPGQVLGWFSWRPMGYPENRDPDIAAAWYHHGFTVQDWSATTYSTLQSHRRLPDPALIAPYRDRLDTGPGGHIADNDFEPIMRLLAWGIDPDELIEAIGRTAEPYARSGFREAVRELTARAREAARAR